MASERSLKRRLSSTSLIDKYKALKEIEEGQSCIATSIKYGVAKNTISHWIKQKQKIFEAVEENNVSKKRKRVKPPTYEELDNATYKWLKSTRYHNIPVGANVLKLKALEFAKKLDLGNFHASDGNDSMLVSKLHRICSCLQSWNPKILKKFSSAENNSLHGTFIPIPSP